MSSPASLSLPWHGEKGWGDAYSTRQHLTLSIEDYDRYSMSRQCLRERFACMRLAAGIGLAWSLFGWAGTSRSTSMCI